MIMNKEFRGWLEKLSPKVLKTLEDRTEFIAFGSKGDGRACLDGDFTSGELRAIALAMDETKRAAPE